MNISKSRLASPAVSPESPATGSVQNIVVGHERLGKSPDEIASEYGLSLADVYAALAYYFDHRAEIDRSIEASDAFVEALRRTTPSKVRQKLQQHSVHGPKD